MDSGRISFRGVCGLVSSAGLLWGTLVPWKAMLHVFLHMWECRPLLCISGTWLSIGALFGLFLPLPFLSAQSSLGLAENGCTVGFVELGNYVPFPCIFFSHCCHFLVYSVTSVVPCMLPPMPRGQHPVFWACALCKKWHTSLVGSWQKLGEAGNFWNSVVEVGVCMGLAMSRSKHAVFELWCIHTAFLCSCV